MSRLMHGLIGMLMLCRAVYAEDPSDVTHSTQEQPLVIGLGIGDLSKGRIVCERVAELAARADLARQLRVEVKERIHDRIRERTGREVEQDIEIVREERVSELLRHVRIVDRQIDSETGTCRSKAIMQK